MSSVDHLEYERILFTQLQLLFVEYMMYIDPWKRKTIHDP